MVVIRPEMDDDDDLEALRLAALQTIKPRAPPKKPQHHHRFHDKGSFHRIRENPNLIAIVPTEVPPTDVEKAKTASPEGERDVSSSKKEERIPSREEVAAQPSTTKAVKPNTHEKKEDKVGKEQTSLFELEEDVLDFDTESIEDGDTGCDDGNSKKAEGGEEDLLELHDSDSDSLEKLMEDIEKELSDPAPVHSFSVKSSRPLKPASALHKKPSDNAAKPKKEKSPVKEDTSKSPLKPVSQEKPKSPPKVDSSVGDCSPMPSTYEAPSSPLHQKYPSPKAYDRGSPIPALIPRRRSLSPRKRSPSPLYRPPSPRRRPLSPRRRSISPRRRSRSPRIYYSKASPSYRPGSPSLRRSKSPRRLSPRRRSVSPRRRRSISPRWRTPSPGRRRSGSPRRRSPSPWRRGSPGLGPRRSPPGGLLRGRSPPRRRSPLSRRSRSPLRRRSPTPPRKRSLSPRPSHKRPLSPLPPSVKRDRRPPSPLARQSQWPRNKPAAIPSNNGRPLSSNKDEKTRDVKEDEKDRKRLRETGIDRKEKEDVEKNGEAQQPLDPKLEARRRKFENNYVVESVNKKIRLKSDVEEERAKKENEERKKEDERRKEINRRKEEVERRREEAEKRQEAAERERRAPTRLLTERLENRGERLIESQRLADRLFIHSQVDSSEPDLPKEKPGRRRKIILDQEILDEEKLLEMQEKLKESLGEKKRGRSSRKRKSEEDAEVSAALGLGDMEEGELRTAGGEERRHERKKKKKKSEKRKVVDAGAEEKAAGDLRMELSRRRAERLKGSSLDPMARIVQSAFEGVVGKRKSKSKVHAPTPPVSDDEPIIVSEKKTKPKSSSNKSSSISRRVFSVRATKSANVEESEVSEAESDEEKDEEGRDSSPSPQSPPPPRPSGTGRSILRRNQV